MIKLLGVSKTYKMGGELVHALDNVSLEIKDGEFAAVIGPSGCGKSTLLHILSTLDRPTSGKILWDKNDLTKFNDKELAKLRNEKVGFVFQQFHLLPKTTVLENILLPTMYSPLKEDHFLETAREIAKELGLENRLLHTPAQLSGGQQQRVAIARALINNPTIILADEPTGNLDSKSGKQIIDILKSLNKKKKLTLVIVTHDLTIAKNTERIIKMKDGKII